jgi:hypothetical protein
MVVELPSRDSPGNRTMRVLYLLAFTMPLLPVLGEFSPEVAGLQFCLMLPMALFLLVFIAIKAFSQPRTLLAIIPVLLGLVLSVRLTMGVPYWVKARAQVLIDAVEAWKATHGSYPPESMGPEFPPELRPALQASQCMFYRPKGTSYSITCGGVAFTKCTYDAAEKSWYGWD